MYYNTRMHMMTQEQFKKAAQYKQAGFGVVNDEHI